MSNVCSARKRNKGSDRDGGCRKDKQKRTEFNRETDNNGNKMKQGERELNNSLHLCKFGNSGIINE